MIDTTNESAHLQDWQHRFAAHRVFGVDTDRTQPAAGDADGPSEWAIRYIPHPDGQDTFPGFGRELRAIRYIPHPDGQDTFPGIGLGHYI